jgi:hypothetical protein
MLEVGASGALFPVRIELVVERNTIGNIGVSTWIYALMVPKRTIQLIGRKKAPLQGEKPCERC